jgi:hypothetical protein
MASPLISAARTDLQDTEKKTKFTIFFWEAQKKKKNPKKKTERN